MSSVFLVALCWIVFGALHSGMIYHEWRPKIQAFLEVDDQTYRLIYALISVISLFACTLTTLLADGEFLKEPDALTYIGGGLLMAGSLYLMKRAFRNYSLTVFIGLQPEANSKLQISGMNRLIRHPLYLSAILFFVGTFVFWPTNTMFTSALILTAYTVIGSRLEERKLIRQFGKDYTDYMKEVPGLIPRFWEE